MAKFEAENELRRLIGDFLKEHELEIHHAEFKKEGPEWKLKVILDKPIDADTEYVSIDECEEVTRYLSDRLDEEDLIDRAYTLEVSSPGLDRELIKEEDFVRFAGRLVDVKLFQPLDGRKEWTAELLGLEDGMIRLKEEENELEIPRDKVSKIQLAVIF